MALARAFVALGILAFGIAAGCGSSSGDDSATAGDGGTGVDTDATTADGANGGQEGGGALGTEGGTSDDGGFIPLDGGGGTSTRTVDKRPYKLVVPGGYVPGTPIPFVLLLHGYAETAATIDSYFGMTALAQKKNFILALPNGNIDNLGLQYLNADDACCDLYNAKPDDVGYLTDVMHDVKSAYNIDPKRVFVAGHSNGAFMSHRMACDHADEIAGIMALAGMVWKDATKCSPAAPVSVLQVQGDADAIVNYNGGMNPGGAYPSSPQTVATWAAKNGCDVALTDTGMTLDLEANLPGAETTIARHACTQGAAELWTIKGGAHIPTFQSTWAETFYTFLAAHPKP